ncbi:920_t:CDS:2, partial [Dentiscutata erythropus]
NESESLNNLQNVLEEFEAEAVEGIQRRLSTTSKELSEFKERALLAEEQLTQTKEEASRTSLYEKEIKEKNLLIGKLRHE